MEPTTIRLSEELKKELDRELTHYGYNSRSGYIRHLLNHRELIQQEMIDPSGSGSKKESEQNQINGKKLEETQSRLAKLEEELNQLKSAADPELNKKASVEMSSDKIKKCPSDSKHEKKSGKEDIFSGLARWLSDGGNGPNKDHAQNILLEAMKFLDKNGPLQRKELLNELYTGEDDPYEDDDSLWESTIRGHYEDIPGFIRLQNGQYDFDKKIALEEIDLPPNIGQWD